MDKSWQCTVHVLAEMPSKISEQTHCACARLAHCLQRRSRFQVPKSEPKGEKCRAKDCTYPPEIMGAIFSSASPAKNMGSYLSTKLGQQGRALQNLLRSLTMYKCLLQKEGKGCMSPVSCPEEISTPHSRPFWASLLAHHPRHGCWSVG